MQGASGQSTCASHCAVRNRQGSFGYCHQNFSISTIYMNFFHGGESQTVLNQLSMDNKAEQTQAGVFRARALLFDMDGTLVDSSPNVERAYRWWAKRHNLSDESILAVQTGRPHREVMAQFAPHLDLDYESAVFTDFEVADEEGMPLIAGAAEL